MKQTIKTKLLMMILMFFCIVTIWNQNVYALGGIISSGEKFENARANYLQEKQPGDLLGPQDKEVVINGITYIQRGMEIKGDDLQKMSNTIYNILLLLGIVIAVIWGMVLGMKFMTGSIEEQAKVKESLIPYIAGCVVVFGAFTIWKIVLEVLKTTM